LGLFKWHIQPTLPREDVVEKHIAEELPEGKYRERGGREEKSKGGRPKGVNFMEVRFKEAKFREGKDKKAKRKCHKFRDPRLKKDE
jgi:hypothetical protein